MTIEELREKGWIAYEFIRGSHAYNLNDEKSDVDVGGVFIIPQDYLYGLRGKYIDRVGNKSSDIVFYEFGRWIELLIASSPMAIESLFIPQNCIVGEIHPAVQKIIDNRELFLSKELFKTLCGYSISQIEKARGLNKKIVNPVYEKQGILDFCYTPKAQGSEPILKFLRERGLKQEFCGLVNIPNMHNLYSVFYDWGSHFQTIKLPVIEKNDYISYDDNEDVADILEDSGFDIHYLINQICDDCFENLIPSVYNQKVLGYRGIVGADSLEVRLSSVNKDDMPICYMSFNKDGYSKHCKQYHDYREWEQNRNPIRYESNLGQNYDGKNMLHCMRLIRMGVELAKTNTLNINRSDDREYLLKIKNHQFEYDEIISQVEKENKKLKELIKTSTLPERIDVNQINSLLIEIRKKLYN